MDFVESWHDHPLLIKAFAEKLRAGWDRACAEMGAEVPVIFTAHSVPQRTITEGDPYEAQAKETAALVAREAASMMMIGRSPSKARECLAERGSVLR